MTVCTAGLCPSTSSARLLPCHPPPFYLNSDHSPRPTPLLLLLHPLRADSIFLGTGLHILLKFHFFMNIFFFFSQGGLKVCFIITSVLADSYSSFHVPGSVLLSRAPGLGPTPVHIPIPILSRQ